VAWSRLRASSCILFRVKGDSGSVGVASRTGSVVSCVGDLLFGTEGLGSLETDEFELGCWLIDSEIQHLRAT
jgi:hypothetical protein